MSFRALSEGHSGHNYYVSKEDTEKFLSNAIPLAVVAVISFFAITIFLVFIANAFELKNEHIGIMAFFSIMGLVIMTLLFAQGGDENAIQSNTYVSISRPQNRRGKVKKFNSAEEYRASQQFLRDKAEADAKKTEQQKLDAKRGEEIELSTKALVSLGFKIKRATDLVSRALDSGIKSSDTQGLVRYALSNNNKA